MDRPTPRATPHRHDAARRGLAIGLLALACAPSRPPSAIPPPADVASLEIDAPEATPAVEPVEPVEPVAPPVVRQPFTWDRLLIAADQVDGPGIDRVAEVGAGVTVLAADGSTRSAHVTTADRCDDPEADRTWCYVAIEYAEELRDDGEPEPAEAFLGPWVYPGRPETSDGDTDGAGDDLALLNVAVAVPADTALPRFVPATFEVRYANALCEAEADDEYVLLRSYSSGGPDPVAGFAGLAARRGYPRRVITVRTAERTFHFVTLSKVRMPRSRRMLDIPRRYDTMLWILEEREGRFTVLHHEKDHGGRNINQDASCSLPLRYPAPWAVVEVDGVTSVLTLENLSTFARWSIHPDGLVADATWRAESISLY